MLIIRAVTILTRLKLLLKITKTTIPELFYKTHGTLQPLAN